MNVLVVDDLKVIRSLVRKALLEHEVRSVDEAEDGIQAWGMIQAKPYHLIITDWNMPKMEGIELVEKIRGHGVTCPIIMQTTNNAKNRVMHAIKSGVTDYILKPYTVIDLIEKLERHVFDAAMQAQE